MANRDSKDRSTRKLTRIGRGSMGITLPVELLVALGWREKQKLRVTRKGQSLVIRDWKK